MKALVLAAGKGERLRPLTDSIPKVMLPIKNKPILQYHIEQLREAGITDIAVNLHHFPEKIRDYFGNGKKLGVNITYSYEKELLGTAGAVKKLKGFLNETFVVVYGDILSELQIKKVIDFHREKSGKATITVHESDHPWDSACVSVNKDGRVIKFVEKPGKENVFSNLTSTALYVIEPEVIDLIPEGHSDFAKDIFPKLLKKGIGVYAYVTDAYRKDIGTPERYKEAKAYFDMKPDISVFFPTYNEQGTIAEIIGKTAAVMEEVANNYEIIVVNDGSTDNTPKIVEEHAKKNKNIRLVTHPMNMGYGAALRSGIASSSYDLIFYTDADLQFDISEIKKLLPLIKDADIVSAYRIKRQDPLMRKITAWAYNQFLRMYLGIGVRDIDCAFKLYKKKIFAGIEIKSDKGTVDVEILAKALKLGFKIVQVGVHHYKRNAGASVFSRNRLGLVPFSYILTLLRETKKLKKELKNL